ncbi:polyprotein-like, partial [Trifolium medium]|nr:polyprotein-like [Trifolium medium]
MNTITEPKTPITTTSAISLPKNCKKTDSHKIENLIEYTYVPDDVQVAETVPPLLSPYNIFRKHKSFTRTVRNLITTNRPHIKEYIQSSRLDQCTLKATNHEQYVDLEIPQNLINHWKTEGYTALHFGAVRLILSLHGRKNQPVFCKVALLDSSYLQYENAVIGTVLTSLHAGSVVLTIFPNYNVSLSDSTLSTRLKVQVQITGSDQVPEALSATLHHQIIYRLQNHSIDLPSTGCGTDSLLVMASREEDIPSIVQIPRRISREELTHLIPLEWITNYERMQEDRRPIQTQEATFRRSSVDKTVKTIFKKIEEGSSSSPSVFQ